MPGFNIESTSGRSGVTSPRSGRHGSTVTVRQNNEDAYHGCGIGRVAHHLTSFGAGAATTAGTTYALVKHVQHAIANAKVSSDPNVWVAKARTVYDNCYNGCNDCDDTSFAYNACATTAKLNVTGSVCNGNAMWNWAARYPEACLSQLGDVLEQQALAGAKQGDRNQLAMSILTVAAGGVVWYASHKALAYLGACIGRRRNLQEQQGV